MMSNVSLSAGWCRAVALFAVIALTGTAADLYTKHRVFQMLGMPGAYKAEPESVYWLWQNIAGFQTSLNTGALFGLGEGRTALLAILSLIFLTGILGYVMLWAWRSLFLASILGMITAGICGNLYDRLGWHGLVYPDGQRIYAVRDWIHCMIGTFPWPNFNIADSLLVCSVIVLLLRELVQDSGIRSQESK